MSVLRNKDATFLKQNSIMKQIQGRCQNAITAYKGHKKIKEPKPLTREERAEIWRLKALQAIEEYQDLDNKEDEARDEDATSNEAEEADTPGPAPTPTPQLKTSIDFTLFGGVHEPRESLKGYRVEANVHFNEAYSALRVNYDQSTDMAEKAAMLRTLTVMLAKKIRFIAQMLDTTHAHWQNEDNILLHDILCYRLCLNGTEAHANEQLDQIYGLLHLIGEKVLSLLETELQIADLIAIQTFLHGEIEEKLVGLPNPAHLTERKTSNTHLELALNYMHRFLEVTREARPNMLLANALLVTLVEHFNLGTDYLEKRQLQQKPGQTKEAYKAELQAFTIAKLDLDVNNTIPVALRPVLIECKLLRDNLAHDDEYFSVDQLKDIGNNIQSVLDEIAQQSLPRHGKNGI